MSHPAPPPGCAVAFKEWAGVCEALRLGRQVLILRKGGIAEDAGRFRPEHPAFWLYPTAVHQATQGLKPDAPIAAEPAPGRVDLATLAVVDRLAWVDDWDRLAALDDLHIWQEATVHNRFHYRHPGLWVLAVRAYHRDPAHTIGERPDFMGCKTWVPLGLDLVADRLTPALAETEFTAGCADLEGRLGPMTRTAGSP